MKILLIANPVAGHRRGQRAGEQAGRLLRESGHDYRLAFTEAPGHATELARAAGAAGHELVVAIGGDGTVHEVVNGLAGSPAALGVIPCGSGNDFARTACLQTSTEAAVRALFTGERRAFDLGRVNDRYFVNVAGVGFDAEAAALANRRGKRRGGAVTYLGAILSTLARYRCSPAEVILDGVSMQVDLFLLAAGNGRFLAGGMKVCPTAVPDDGLLEVVLGDGLGKLETLAVLPRVYGGGHVRHPKVSVFAAREVTVRPQADLTVQADGEIVGKAPATFSVVPGGLQVVGCGRRHVRGQA